MTSLPQIESLAALEAGVRQALRTGEDSHLEVLGYGEISTVLACEGHACKRLPPFPSVEAYAAYASTFERYLADLRDAGCPVVESTLLRTDNPDGSFTVWCVQPLKDTSTFLEKRLGEDGAEALLQILVERVASTIHPRLGLDAQASNWVWADGELAYLDVTTPMLRDAGGREQLDTDLFLASLPWALRGGVRRFLLSSILDKYYEPRGALIDLAGNLLKEGLEPLIAPLISMANEIVDRPIERAEVDAYYREDARMWALLQRLRRADRWWQMRRGRVYPFLLPGNIERNV